MAICLSKHLQVLFYLENIDTIYLIIYLLGLNELIVCKMFRKVSGSWYALNIYINHHYYYHRWKIL